MFEQTMSSVHELIIYPIPWVNLLKLRKIWQHYLHHLALSKWTRMNLSFCQFSLCFTNNYVNFYLLIHSKLINFIPFFWRQHCSLSIFLHAEPFDYYCYDVCFWIILISSWVNERLLIPVYLISEIPLKFSTVMSQKSWTSSYQK